ncbi:hypothetical protein [Mesorhizobium sp.]|uniref:hypothetical protein n=1 Tax=Mesorhizobium sp. TaxID=1871066 RepID=UPI000FE7EBEA|nr:hypothetical protein [Mesorhizobium sp.]RWK44266.1 MAG: hypothetical protein EOR46_02865 [Mesorhizobium sp.]RWK81340.1 MAG: hypothetical protein EOR50_02865 [Mesorhizobium sp.]RWK85023.1 MAG: hypothetical protein EOR51_01055 [Mesorhizobium sp.]RWL04285.1 MAG: hypothetical protein EOR55_16145 [Mesorhizobium sp.]RWL16389.1 MAG: hypothetical protein EOR56_02860 [Mesorhizobium sp.]
MNLALLHLFKRLLQGWPLEIEEYAGRHHSVGRETFVVNIRVDRVNSGIIMAGVTVTKRSGSSLIMCGR